MTKHARWAGIASLVCAGALVAAAAPRSVVAAPSVDDARSFLAAAQKDLLALTVEQGRADWVRQTYITDDTEALASAATDRLMGRMRELSQEAKRFDGLALPADLARQLMLLKLALVVPPPADPAERKELSDILARMDSDYGKGKWCRPGPDGKEQCLDLTAISRILRESRNPQEMLDAWRGWHAIAPPMRKDFDRYVQLGNQGARDLGFADMGALWRSKYDMPPDDFAREVDRLWEQVRPLYVSLHTYVRNRLREAYGPAVVPASGPLPAHLLGNMWAQEWGNVYPLVAPKDADSGIDLTARLRAKGVDEREMARIAERFFLSLGLDPLPATFWERSLFTKPRDREVVCHASAWDIDYKDDLRIKMCIEITDEDFRTIHHEMGHNYYQRAYNMLPPLYQDSANDGFHEALGDTLALSVTPGYLKSIGLIDGEPDPSKDVGLLLQMALDKVAFLPFGLVVDQWRWKAFSGEVPPSQLNAAWWRLREKYQGVAPAVARSEADFDPGAKYHVPASVPYTRYFLADILQFQFHRALCRAAGQTGPLNRQSIYGNKEVGRRLKAMMEMGASRPWPEALKALTGEERIDATAMLDYFAPLQKWLDEQNKGKPQGW
jgi:peptidyl-dipeptidase A